MIGPPSSGTTGGMSNHDGGENTVRLKRRTFEDLDIENICDEICHNAKKRNTLDRDPLEIALADIVNASSSSLSSSSSSSSPSSSLSQFPLVNSSIQEQTENSSGGAAALARLEVLVVDGSWDVTSFGESDLIDLSTSATDETSVEHLTSVDSSENGYSTVLSYWESPAPQELIENSVDQCRDIVENSEPPQSTTSDVPTATSANQQDDHEHGNLSWLLDFKLDSLIEAPEEKTNVSCACHNQIVLKSRQQHTARADNISYVNTSTASCGTDNNEETIVQREKQLNSIYGLSDNKNYSMNHYNGPKKPPFTYTELIEHALQERGELTVSAIYQWISEHFPYYKSNDDRWKNSVRHNLSINPHFRKGSKAPHGAGHLWAIANRNETRPRQLIANIPGLSTTTQRPTIVKQASENNYAQNYSSTTRQPVAVDEVAAATASISDATEENVLTSITLEHCAEQILSGIKREVEVQYLLPMAVQDTCDLDSNQQIEQNEQACDDKDTERECWNVLADFLNPVAKEVVAEECGLIGEGYLVTDLNPATLGLNIVEPEIITPDHLFGEELSFQFYELASPSQLQSA